MAWQPRVTSRRAKLFSENTPRGPSFSHWIHLWGLVQNSLITAESCWGTRGSQELQRTARGIWGSPTATEGSWGTQVSPNCYRGLLRELGLTQPRVPGGRGPGWMHAGYPIMCHLESVQAHLQPKIGEPGNTRRHTGS